MDSPQLANLCRSAVPFNLSHGNDGFVPKPVTRCQNGSLDEGPLSGRACESSKRFVGVAAARLNG